MISTSATRMPVLMPTHPWTLTSNSLTLDPMWMLWKTSEGQHRAFLPHNLKESPVCCWASGRQAAPCGTFSVSLLSEVFSSRAVAVHPAYSAHMTIQMGVPSEGSMRKSVLVENSWACCPLILHEVWRDTLKTWHTTLYGSSSYWSFTFLFPLSPGSGKTALAFLS